SLVETEESDALRVRLEKAREVLGEPKLRAEYDRTLGLPLEPTPAPEPVASEPPAPVVPVSAPVEAPAAPAEAASAPAEVVTVPAEVVTALTAMVDPVTAPAATVEPPAPPVPVPVATEEPHAHPRIVEARPRIPEVGPDTEFNGELLRQLREARGLSLKTL